MTCPACAEAMRNPNTGMYRAGCKECSARALAAAPAHFLAAQAPKLLPEYKNALQAVFGDDWRAGHLRVKAWSQRAKRT